MESTNLWNSQGTMIIMTYFNHCTSRGTFVDMQKNHLTRDYNSHDKMFIFHKRDYFYGHWGLTGHGGKTPTATVNEIHLLL